MHKLGTNFETFPTFNFFLPTPCPKGVKMLAWLETQSKLKAGSRLGAETEERKGRWEEKGNQEGTAREGADGSHGEGQCAELQFKRHRGRLRSVGGSQ